MSPEGWGKVPPNASIHMTLVSEGSFMGPECGPLPSSKGSGVWALNCFWVYEAYIRGKL